MIPKVLFHANAFMAAVAFAGALAYSDPFAALGGAVNVWAAYLLRESA